jgi:TIR domain/Sulfatase-modifying factor enzyme 1
LAGGAPNGPDVFLSYAREDEARARELATALEQLGFSVFWDREVPPGQTWRSYIGDALAKARCVVVAWSRYSIASDWVIEEANEGRDRNVLVPVLFETVPPPFGFRAIQAANLTDWRPGLPSPAFDSLLRAVQRIIGGQAGSGTGVKAELSAPPRPAPSEPPPQMEPTVRPPAPSTASSEPAAALPLAAGWPRLRVAAMAVGLVVLAGAGGIVLQLTQPRPTGPTAVSPPSVPEPVPSIAQPKSSESGVEAASAAAPEQTAVTSTGTGGSPEGMRDCPQCPEMLLVPAGEFTMGSPPGEEGRDDDEPLPRKVTIPEPFWVGKYEVTFAEWDACVAAGGCSSKPDDAGWGRDNRPVIKIAWRDANAYVYWLIQKTK